MLIKIFPLDLLLLFPFILHLHYAFDEEVALKDDMFNFTAAAVQHLPGYIWTFLCNELEIKVNFQGGVPVFHLSRHMTFVCVWWHRRIEHY